MKPDRDTNTSDRSSAETCGFVGLGAMGLPIARHIATAVDCLAVSDISADRLDLLIDAGIPNVIEDRDILNTAETVFLCLPTQAATQAVVEDLAKRPGIDRTIIDFGAHPPEFISKLNEICQSASAQYCDCPVFGTPLMAEQGELYFLFSGPQEVSEWFEPLAHSLGYRMRYAGPPGTASLLKLLQNAIGTSNLAVGAEALRICEATGVDPSLFIGIVAECGGIGQSSVFGRFADDMAARNDSGEGRLRIAAKDMHSVVSLAASVGVTAPLMAETDRQYARAMQEGLGEQQFTEIIRINDGGKPSPES